MNTIERKVTRTRSPAYPVINLKEAISKADVLWSKERTGHIPKLAALQNLGYESVGGYAGRVIAALKQYGLVTDKGDDIVLTQDAVDLALHNYTGEECNDIVRRMALKPSIYRLIFNEYDGQLPSDNTLKIKLVKGYRFNVDKVAKFIKDFRSTIAYAGLSGAVQGEIEGSKIGDEYEEINKPEVSSSHVTGTDISKPKPPVVKETGRSYPLPGGIIITFDSLPVKKKTLDKLKQWLDLYEDDLTSSGNENNQVMEEQYEEEE